MLRHVRRHSAVEPCKNGRTSGDAVLVVDSDGPKEACVRWGSDPHAKGQFLGENRLCRTKTLCRNLRKSGWTNRDAVWAVYSVGRWTHVLHGGAHWRKLANTIDPPTFAWAEWSGCDAAFCQILCSQLWL